MKDYINTYCNPIKVIEYPRGEATDHRSLADPSVIYHEGKWYMYPSYGMMYYTEDFITWKHHDLGLNLGYAPTVAVIDGKFYLLGRTEIMYVADSPFGPFKEIGKILYDDESPLVWAGIDPMIFVDDDGRVYIYYVGRETREDGVNIHTILGVELDRKNPTRVIGEPVRLFGLDYSHEWERFGERNQNATFGYTEGPWMYKRDGRYYLLYSGSGTAFGSYAMGAYYSDEGPLSGFVYQKYNPISNRRYGLVSGGGHGAICDGPDGKPWAFYTCPLGYMHRFERVVGMDPVIIDENKEIRVLENSDYPRWAPGVVSEPYSEGDTGLLPLSYNQVASATSNSLNALYSIDENIKSYWAPSDDDTAPALTVYLTHEYDVSAVRVIWRERELDIDNGILPAPIRYTVEVSVDGKEWETLLDKSENTCDLLIDYEPTETRLAKYARLNILGGGAKLPGVIDFTVFGKLHESRT